jgi:dienelactone hydrolase
MVDQMSGYQEQPTFFRAGRETLFGLFSTPPRDELSTTVIVLGGGGTTPTAIGRNRFFVTLCRRLALLGYHAFRFDYHGLGESTGTAEFRLDRPFLKDLEGAVSLVEGRGLLSYVLVGSCFGARTALSGGPGLAGLRGVVLLAPPLRDFALSEPRTAGWRPRDYAAVALHPRRLLGEKEKVTLRRYLRFAGSGTRVLLRRLRDRLPGQRGELSWVSGRFLDPLSSLAEQGVPVLLLYGTEDDEYRDFELAQAGRLGEIMARWPTVEVRSLVGQVHGFTQLDSQGPTSDLIVDWITRIAPSAL